MFTGWSFDVNHISIDFHQIEWHLKSEKSLRKVEEETLSEKRFWCGYITMIYLYPVGFTNVVLPHFEPVFGRMLELPPPAGCENGNPWVDQQQQKNQFWIPVLLNCCLWSRVRHLKAMVVIWQHHSRRRGWKSRGSIS